MILNYDKYSLQIDNKPFVIRSAAFHYFRNPGLNVWKDRISKLKACGYNTVDLYFPWSYHSSDKGIYDFTGVKDVRQLLDIISDLDMFVIARPGPYINAELSAGGLPPWLFNLPDIVLRNRKDCNYIYSKSYMQAVKEWYSRIIPIILEYNNVIAFQIENEYATNQAEPDYMQELYDLARNLGVKVPIFHNDAFCGCLYSDIVDIYAFDVYPTISFDFNWRENPDIFGTLDYAEENLKDCSPDSPLYIAELQSGWFDRWSGQGYALVRQELGRQHINIVTKTALSQGITMFNHFMACGGTSWGQLASAEVYTSYDFAAPISEYGVPQENYYQAKEVNYFLKAFNLAKTDLIASENDLLEELEQENIFAKLRKDNINNCNWLFIRNLNQECRNIKIKNIGNIALNAFDMKILPQDLNLLGCKVDFSSFSIFAKISNENNEKIFLILDENSEIAVSDFELTELSQDIPSKKDKDKVKIFFENIPTNDLLSCKFFRGGKTTEFIFIKQSTADKTWIMDNKAVIGPNLLTDDNQIAGFNKSSDVKIIDINHFEISKKEEIILDNNVPEFKPLEFECYTCAPEIDNVYDYSEWNLVEKDSFDCISNKVYDEFIWYKGAYKGIIKQIQINAKHCWAIYLNGKEIYSHDSFHFECGREINEEITINMGQFHQHKEIDNILTILVQNMGFDKGFQNEPDLPRGILSFKPDPIKEIEWRIRGNITPNIEEWSFIEPSSLEDASENSYLKWLTSSFELDLPEDTFVPLYIEVENPPFDKANIYLNGVQIGNYWKSKGPQAQFYLMDGFLKSKNTLSLLVWDRNKNQQIEDFNLDNINVNIKIRNFGRYKLVDLENLI